jgi:hypothetical protein
MDTISVPANLADVLGKATAPVELVNERGELLGKFSPASSTPAGDELSPAELAAIKSRMSSPGPWHTTEQVLTHIQSRGQR